MVYKKTVLILILMECLLSVWKAMKLALGVGSLNPYSNGMLT